MKIQSIEDLQKSNRPVLTKPTPEKKDSQSIQKAVEQTVIAATASRAAVDKVSIVVEDNMRLTSSLVEQLEAVINTLPEEAELSVWQKNLEDIGKRIERLGAINLAAIEEFDTESERKKYLDSQNDELESALTTLENAIQKIDI
jgi:chromosome segregation ATPase